ncbi:uncharacterized protein LOC132169197 [Corylus avellana]|uniref:uncharacterized protein LOC132169197 n=1 Tax=Corylus avellana TaxID=13451 RepID=UPI001E20256E|nr:uncharacterized protein LOC132169197 [Corylus avellana]
MGRNESKVTPGQATDPANDHHDQHSAADKQSAGIQLQRNKSCGEGRAIAPADELTLSRLPKTNKNDGGDSCEKGFKCSILCLFWPGFGRGKKKEEAVVVTMEDVISRTVSLEKFECGSWASSAICRSSDEGGDSKHLYFDLPMELIRSGVIDDANSPVTAAFVFDKDHHRKGILKKHGTTTRAAATKSDESSGRHVRFSTSCPESPVFCISPRLLKAREDFSAFLEAQS